MSGAKLTQEGELLRGRRQAAGSPHTLNARLVPTRKILASGAIPVNSSAPTHAAALASNFAAAALNR